MPSIFELHYSKTNTYLIEGSKKTILFDTGWAGSFGEFERELHRNKKSVADIDYILMSHYHPDHCGLAQEIADKGAVILAADVQAAFFHYADAVYEKEGNKSFMPVKDSKVKVISCAESREFLSAVGIDGELLYTPGHSDDSITLILDEGSAFVGDLNPLYELELHKGTQIEDSWNLIFSHNPKTLYYGHAKKHRMDEADEKTSEERKPEKTQKVSFFSKLFGRSQKKEVDETYTLVSDIMSMIDSGTNIDRICKITGADRVLVEDINRMYLTHPGVSVQGILDRIEIKGR